MISPVIRTVMSSCIGIVFLFFVAHYMSSHFLGTASRILYPFIRLQHGIVNKLQHISHITQSQHHLLSSLEELQRSHDTLLAENIELRSQLIFIEQTDELISYKKRFKVNSSSLGHIILRTFSDYEQSILIDKGSAHGVEVDMVAVNKNCLVGRVTHVYPYYSKVVLITDSDCKIAAFCTNSKAQGITVGLNTKEYITLEYVPHLQTLKYDDLVVSSGEGVIFPQGFALGRVSTFKLNGLYYDITLKPLIDFNTVNYCYLIKKGAY